MLHAYHFHFMKHGVRAPLSTADHIFSDRNQAKEHCKDLYEGTGRAMGADYVQVLEDESPIVIFSWPNGM